MRVVKEPPHKNGFTLIELIIVIVILGILSVVAAPRFLDIQSDAKKATLMSLASALESAANLQNIQGMVKNGEASKINGYVLDGIYFDRGYPIGVSWGDTDNIPEIIEATTINSDDFLYLTNFTGSSNDSLLTRELYITVNKGLGTASDYNDIVSTNCYVEYESYVQVSREPTITIEVSGC